MLIPVRAETRRALGALRVILGARSYDEVILRLVDYAPEELKARLRALLEARA